MTAGDLQRLRGCGAFEAVDFHFGDFLMRRMPSGSAELALGGMFLMRALRNGDSCVDLRPLAGTGFPPEAPLLRLPEFDDWKRHFPPETANAPVVLDAAGRLYLFRYHSYECETARRLAGHAQLPCVPFDLAPGALARLHDYFAAAAGDAEADRQQAAVYAAGSCGFSLITGGPGTGKTTVIAALLALELERDPSLEIALAAPTGKAQARMKEALTESLDALHVSAGTRALLELLPSGTIHSYLAPRGDGTFRFDEENPLPHALWIVDECSMIPLELMHHFLRAVRPDARLVFLGDRNQLAAVEAGAVLADLCDSAAGGYPEPVCAGFRRATGWELPVSTGSGAVLTELNRNYRFAGAPAIGDVAAWIQTAASDPRAAARAIVSRRADEFRVEPVPAEAFESRLAAEAELPRVGELRLADLPMLARDGRWEDAFELLKSFRVLCALREGRYGVANVNRIFLALLRLEVSGAPGTPLMILRNDRRTGLHNGDVGLIGGRNGVVRFPGVEREFRLAELPEHETVFAMTVHKSQGSGFDSVLLILPEGDTRTVTRELLYTGITRARRKVEIWADEKRIESALASETVRHSGLAERLRSAYRSLSAGAPE